MTGKAPGRQMGVHFPNLYLWLVFLSALDVVMTRIILYFGGIEVNPVAEWVINIGGQMGMSIFKFFIVAFVIVVCEYAATLDLKTARKLAIAGCCITALPVIWSSGLVIEMIMTYQPGTEEVYPHGLDQIFEHREAVENRGGPR